MYNKSAFKNHYLSLSFLKIHRSLKNPLIFKKCFRDQEPISMIEQNEEFAKHLNQLVTFLVSYGSRYFIFSVKINTEL
jgi:hypothetical protein